MFDLAHVTDLHLVEREHDRRTGIDWQRLHYLSAGRSVDYASRRRKALAALRCAARNAAHVVLTGDLTEDGIPAQYELLAELLSEAELDPSRVTLVPGNHDRYADPQAFETALDGPLRRYAATSCEGKILPLGRDAWLLPVCTAIPQSFLRSAGRLADHDVDRIHQLATEARRARKLALVVQHHPPHGFGGPAWNWIDGLLNAAVGRALLQTHPSLQILHGHTHKVASVSFAEERPAQAHSSAAVVARAENLRFYQITRDGLIAVEQASAPVMGQGNAGCVGVSLQ